VDIVGRNEQLGSNMVTALKEASPNPGAQFTFTRADVTAPETPDAVAGKYNATGSLSYLILCAGGLNYGPRRETPEGVELTFAQNVLSRFRFIQRLVPSLSKAGESGAGSSVVQPSAAVVNVLGAGNGTRLDMVDPQMKKDFSFIKAAGSCASFTDLAMEAFARHFPGAHEPR
jgi:NAD(P)-dependent dehydrogenase (short-subunit alcohol dehydrogenase family)